MYKYLTTFSIALIGLFSNVASAKWVATTQKAYGWNGSTWQLDEIYKNTYNQSGQKMVQTVTDADGSVNRETYTWDLNGMLKTRQKEYARSASSPFQKTQRLTRTYDDRLTSFITFNDQLIFQNNEWVPSNSYKQTITRNAEGNITSMERAVYFLGIYDPTFHINIEYGDDGKATAITTEDLAYDYASQSYYWKPGTSYKDIQWDATDGQIVSIDNLFDGPNRIKSATATIGGQECHITAEYADDGSWTSWRTLFDEDMDMDLEEKIEYTPTDEFGSSIVVITMGYLNDGIPYNTEQYTYTYQYSPEELLLLEESVFTNDEGTEVLSRIEGTIEYDAEFGYPLSWTVTEFDAESGSQTNSLRAEYSDYVKVDTDSSIESIETGLTDDPTLCDLQGHTVLAPQKGKILIRRSTKGTEKVIF